MIRCAFLTVDFLLTFSSTIDVVLAVIAIFLYFYSLNHLFFRLLLITPSCRDTNDVIFNVKATFPLILGAKAITEGKAVKLVEGTTECTSFLLPDYRMKSFYFINVYVNVYTLCGLFQLEF